MAIAANGLTASGALTGNPVTDRALYLKMFSGEVLTAFDKKNIMMGLHKVMTPMNGKSHQFPILGNLADSVVSNHTPGAEVSTTNIGSGEREIYIEELQYVSLLIDKFEDKLAHFEYRGEYAKRMGEALATKMDKRIFIELLRGMAGPASVGTASQPSGSIIDNSVITSGATAAIRGDALIETLFEAQRTFDANDVPTGDRYFVTTPENYYNLVQSTRGVNKDWTNGNGGYDSGVIDMIAGLKILTSNNLVQPSATTLSGLSSVNNSVNSGLLNTPQSGELFKAQTSLLQGILWTPDAVATVKAGDVMSEANYIPERLGDLVTSTYGTGHGVINPGCIIGISNGAFSTVA
jgi:hypothetical protein